MRLRDKAPTRGYLRAQYRYAAQFRAEVSPSSDLLQTTSDSQGEWIRLDLLDEETKRGRRRLAERIVHPRAGDEVGLRLSRWLRTPLAQLGRGRRGPTSASVDPPALALRLFSREDAAHYAREWGAHLWELVAGGEHRQARRDRRRMALSAPWLALQLRTRALLRRRLRSPR